MYWTTFLAVISSVQAAWLPVLPACQQCRTVVSSYSAQRTFKPAYMREGGPLEKLGNIFGLKKKEKPSGGALTNGLDQMLKGAPFPLQLAGAMFKPLVGALEQTLAAAQDDTDELLSQARSCLRADNQIRSLLGEDVEVGSVFSTMSSSTTVNGRSQRSIQLQFYVQAKGAQTQAVADAQGVSESGDGMRLTSLRVNLGGRTISVELLRGGNGVGDTDGVIDIEAS